MPALNIFELPHEPSLGELIGGGLGAGIQQGAGQYSDMMMKQLAQKQQLDQLSKALGFGGQQQPSSQNGEPAVQGEQTPTLESKVAAGRQQEQVDQRVKQITDNPQAMLALATTNKGYADVLSNMRTSIDKREIAQGRIDAKRELAGGKDVGDWLDKLDTIQQSGDRYARMQELFAPENDSKFPSNIAVGLFGKGGQLNDTAYAALTRHPEVQEAVKLIYQDLQGAREMFGARVTNFDVATYLQQLPSLLNTPEGRRQILTDLKMLNGFNQKYYTGVLDIMKQKGGTAKTTLTDARMQWRNENKDYMNQFRENFAQKRLRIVNINDPTQDFLVTPSQAEQAQKTNEWKIVR